MSKKVRIQPARFAYNIFAGEKSTCMKVYMHPSLRNVPNHFNLYVGTNDLVSEKMAKRIGNTIINLATSL